MSAFLALIVLIINVFLKFSSAETVCFYGGNTLFLRRKQNFNNVILPFIRTSNPYLVSSEFQSASNGYSRAEPLSSLSSRRVAFAFLNPAG